jgi:hypothetical protein
MRGGRLNCRYAVIRTLCSIAWTTSGGFGVLYVGWKDGADGLPDLGRAAIILYAWARRHSR